MERNFDDIISLSRPESPGRPPMPMLQRAAQFSPFAALSGYDAAIAEAGRLTEEKIEIGEEEQEALNETLRVLQGRIREKPFVRITCFKKDASKAGGAYVTFSGPLKRLNETEGTLHLTDGTVIALDDILEIESEALPEAGAAD